MTNRSSRRRFTKRRAHFALLAISRTITIITIIIEIFFETSLPHIHHSLCHHKQLNSSSTNQVPRFEIRDSDSENATLIQTSRCRGIGIYSWRSRIWIENGISRLHGASQSRKRRVKCNSTTLGQSCFQATDKSFTFFLPVSETLCQNWSVKTRFQSLGQGQRKWYL